jgi:hypothetical protein
VPPTSVIRYQSSPATVAPQSADHDPPLTASAAVTTVFSSMIEVVLASVDGPVRSRTEQLLMSEAVSGVGVGVGAGAGVGLEGARPRALGLAGGGRGGGGGGGRRRRRRARHEFEEALGDVGVRAAVQRPDARAVDRRDLEPLAAGDAAGALRGVAIATDGCDGLHARACLEDAQDPGVRVRARADVRRALRRPLRGRGVDPARGSGQHDEHGKRCSEQWEPGALNPSMHSRHPSRLV